jgi:hypothetical protein
MPARLPGLHLVGRAEPGYSCCGEDAVSAKARDALSVGTARDWLAGRLSFFVGLSGHGGTGSPAGRVPLQSLRTLGAASGSSTGEASRSTARSIRWECPLDRPVEVRHAEDRRDRTFGSTRATLTTSRRSRRLTAPSCNARASLSAAGHPRIPPSGQPYLEVAVARPGCSVARSGGGGWRAALETTVRRVARRLPRSRSDIGRGLLVRRDARWTRAVPT